ncbi:uncharacterized protein BDZ99DRAFT_576650 [Mytilinidion resinicola]|uniref:Mid2 domain-containing protein n=1 Tax=Mytilinidion resinicola TaxID=574789 RepID=A0A6A6Y2N1_9PEZI|nr:uncharacterized protein BDZ99DRAFT_576650 [Mytilinidion resinicola]KAF2802783.1 hypothetical protein BDZ99DRAFT_576650 [Mytilinidion resinicola]
MRNSSASHFLALLSFALLTAAQSTIQSTHTLQITHTAAATSAAAAATSAPAAEGYNGGTDNPEDPSDAGASGSSQGAFSLSKGALAAIIVVVVVVVIGGAASATLFYLAKKRQWDVRQSIRRASRRLTGRSIPAKTPTRSQNRRTGVRIASPPPSAKMFMPKGGSGRDVEKGLGGEKASGPRTTTTITSQFEVETPRQKGWKGYFGGAR